MMRIARPSLAALILILFLFLIMSALTACASSRVQAEAPITMVGIVTDEHCFLKKPEPELDSKKCLQMPACAATGYGIAVLQSDKTYKFYYLDGDFAPAATGGQDLAIKLIDASTRIDHFYVSVTGKLAGENRKAADGQSYPLIQVSALSETNG